MGKGLIFFCCSCCILVLTIVNLSIGPIISGSVGYTYSNLLQRSYSWGNANCKAFSDVYDDKIDNGTPKDDLKYSYKWAINECKRKKGMHDMEYTSFIFDIVIGFVCSLIGLLHLFDLKKDLVSTTGLIGLGCGIVGFVLTFVYVIFNGIVYTSYYDDNTIYKTDGDGAFAEKVESGKYECTYFDELPNTHALIAKYSDLIKKQYNYNKDLKDSYNEDPSKQGCQSSPTNCNADGFIIASRKYSDNSGSHDCEYLYIGIQSNEITNKDKSDRFLAALILSLFVCLANIGLALFGFLLFRSPNDF